MTPLEREIGLANLREKARAFCDWATKNGAGVRLADPEYLEITERRDRGPRYSSCGDLAHALLEHLGVKAPWVNRKSQGTWQDGANVNRLARSPVGNDRSSPLARALRPDEQLQSGDIAIAWREGGTASDAHVFIIDTHGPDAISSWDYGQGAMSEEAWRRNPDQVEGVHKSRRILGSIPIVLQFYPRKTVPVPLVDFGSVGVKAIQSVLTLEDLFAWLYPIPEVSNG